jgi:putative endonuclease
MRDTSYSLYIIRCADGTLYTGIATDVERRLREHESGARGARYLRGRGPLRVEFCETLGSRARAQRYEYRVKRLQRKHKEALIEGRRSLVELAVE